MSNSHNHLWPAVYFVKSYIPQLEAFPGDYITVLWGFRAFRAFRGHSTDCTRVRN